MERSMWASMRHLMSLYKWPGRRRPDRGQVSLSKLGLANNPARDREHVTRTCRSVSGEMMDERPRPYVCDRDDGGVALDRPIGGCGVAVSVSTYVRS